MEEKRKAKRMPITLELNISKLFKQDNIVIENVDEIIDVNDISKTGIGFYCNSELPIDYYFDAKIQLPNNHFFTVLKIIRADKKEDNKYFIGAEFVGLGIILSKRIDEYEEELHNE